MLKTSGFPWYGQPVSPRSRERACRLIQCKNCNNFLPPWCLIKPSRPLLLKFRRWRHILPDLSKPQALSHHSMYLLEPLTTAERWSFRCCYPPEQGDSKSFLDNSPYIGLILFICPFSADNLTSPAAFFIDKSSTHAVATSEIVSVIESYSNWNIAWEISMKA